MSAPGDRLPPLRRVAPSLVALERLYAHFRVPRQRPDRGVAAPGHQHWPDGRDVRFYTSQHHTSGPRTRSAPSMTRAKPPSAASAKVIFVDLDRDAARRRARGRPVSRSTAPALPARLRSGQARPDGAATADKMLFMVAAMAAEMERDLIRADPGRAARRAGSGPPRWPPGRCER